MNFVMIEVQLKIVFIVLTVIATRSSADHWAVLVAGSNGWYNYRHQADLCHAYQILHNNGIPDSNIIVMMYDDIANHRDNPTKGIIINKPGGKDVYKGVPRDYVGPDVTPKNFLNVLLGEKEKMKHIGSGKVLQSGPNDNVFIFFTDHGSTGLVAFPNGVLYATDLNRTIMKMHEENRYNRMVIYIEACESGSMLENILVDNVQIYATTASNAEESSYACYFDSERNTYLGDVYSVTWMENSDLGNLDHETLFQQYSLTKEKTNTSHVMQYGDLNLGKEHYVSEFQTNGTEIHRSSFTQPTLFTVQDDVVPVPDVRLAIISRRLAQLNGNSEDREELERQLAEYLRDRSEIFDRINKICSILLSSSSFSQVIDQRLKLKNHRCYRSITEVLDAKCFDLHNELVLTKLYIFSNLCEIGFNDFLIIQAIDQVCQDRLDLNS